MPTPRLAAALVAALLALTACAARREAETSGAAAPTAPDAAPEPVPVTVTPSRFDAYVLALRNVRAAHPEFAREGASRSAIRETMREAVGRAGLTLEEFAGLHAQVQADPMLRAEAERRVAGLPPQPQSGARPSVSPPP